MLGDLAAGISLKPDGRIFSSVSFETEGEWMSVLSFSKKKNIKNKIANLKFIVPTKDEFTAYADEKKIPRSIAGDCYYYYDKIGWTVGKDQKPMVSWKSALAGWWNREKQKL